MVCTVLLYHTHLQYLSLIFGAPIKGQTKNNYSILIMCPPPRKSLVKGERFIRSEGRPE